MKRLSFFLSTSVGKKFLVAVSGLGLSGFVLTHMSGNLLILCSAETYNKYSHALISNPLIEVAEVGLLVLLITHVFLAVKLTMENRSARPIGPSRSASNCEKRARFGSSSMILSGLLIFVFTVLHLITFKYGPHYPVTYAGVEMRDLHRLVVEKFTEPLYVGWYVFALIVLGVHLSHGITALFQTFGCGSVKNCCAVWVGRVFAVLIAGGFIVQPLYVMFVGVK